MNMVVVSSEKFPLVHGVYHAYHIIILYTMIYHMGLSLVIISPYPIIFPTQFPISPINHHW